MEFEKLQKIISEVLNVEPDKITMDTTFIDDLGADSLDVFQIIMGIEEEFDIEIANENAENIVTVRDAVEQIKNAINGFKRLSDRQLLFYVTANVASAAFASRSARRLAR